MKHETGAIMLAIAMASIGAQIAGAQTTTTSQDAKSNPYAGVSKPPSDDEIVATPDAPPPVTGSAISAKTAIGAPKPTAPTVVSFATPKADSFRDQDGDIVTSVNRPSAATLQKRNAEADADLVTSVRTRPGELAEGTNLRVRLLGPLSTTETQKGEAFTGLVTTDVTQSGKVIVPMGSELRGQVVFVRAGSKLGPRPALHLRPDVLILPDGSRYALHAQVVGTQGSNTKADSEGGIVAKSQIKKDAVEYGAAAGSGAIIGAQVAGGVGALVGAGIGAGLVTTHLLLQEHQAELPKNAIVIFGLTEPMTLAPVQN